MIRSTHITLLSKAIDLLWLSLANDLAADSFFNQSLSVRLDSDANKQVEAEKNKSAN